MKKNQDIKKTQLHVDFYVEGNTFVAYCRALDLSTCGNSFEEAKIRFEEAAQVFIEETIKMGTLKDVLLECGWKQAETKDAFLTPPAFVGSIEENISIPLQNA